MKIIHVNHSTYPTLILFHIIKSLLPKLEKSELNTPKLVPKQHIPLAIVRHQGEILPFTVVLDLKQSYIILFKGIYALILLSYDLI